jgi:hypothetical protein
VGAAEKVAVAAGAGEAGFCDLEDLWGGVDLAETGGFCAVGFCPVGFWLPTDFRSVAEGFGVVDPGVAAAFLVPFDVPEVDDDVGDVAGGELVGVRRACSCDP